MTPREELALRRQIAAAQEAGNSRAELDLRRLLVEGGPSGFDAGEMVSNIPSSAAKFAQDMLSAVTNPRQTLEAVGGLVESGLERLNPFMGPEDYQYQQYPQAVGEALKERYGGREEALRTLQTDPIGMLADVSGAVTGAGAATRVPAISAAGRALDPVNLAVNVPKAAATSMIPRGAPASMYESAAKYIATGPTRTPEMRERATETALREKIMPTTEGLERIAEKLNAFDIEINRLIKKADETGTKIPRRRIYDGIAELREDLKKGAGGPGNLRQSERIVEDLEEMYRGGPDFWSPSELQNFKTATYRDINWKVDPGPDTKTMQTLARGAREAIAELSPELAAINRQYGPLAHLREALQRPAKRIGNLNPINLMMPLTATGGAAIGDVPGAIAGATAGATMNPHILARLALATRRAQERGITGQLTSGSPSLQMLRQGLLQSGRLQDLMEEESQIP